MNFVAIDFETANETRHSACSIGIVDVTDGKITDQKHFLIRPHQMYFNPYNISIHGITKNHVKNAPTFNELWPMIKRYFSNKYVIAHNASFDFSVLRNVLDHYNIPYPEVDYSCTRIISKKAWPNFTNYGLSVLSEHFGICFDHHNAQEDARACAQLAILAFKETGTDSFEELAEKLKFKNGRIFPGHYLPASTTANRR